MAQAETLLSPQDRRIIAAAAAYCAGSAAIERLCGQYDDVPPELAKPCYRRMQAAKRRALRCPAATMAGVIAKARMIEAGELFDVNPLIESAIRDLLAVQERSSSTRQASSSVLPLTSFLGRSETLPVPRPGPAISHSAVRAAGSHLAVGGRVANDAGHSSCPAADAALLPL